MGGTMVRQKRVEVFNKFYYKKWGKTPQNPSEQAKAEACREGESLRTLFSVFLLGSAQKQASTRVWIIFKMIKTVLLVVILLLAQSNQQAFEPVQIIYVSGSPKEQVSPAYSSLVGGTLIYLKVTGHSRMASDNLVFVGDYPCIIPADGVTDAFITCETSNSGSQTDIYSLIVKLFSNGQTISTSYPNVVHYSYWSTPLLMGVYPTAGISATSINLWGYHRITYLGDGFRDIGQVKKLSIGGDVCNTFDIKQGPISANSLQPINCLQSNIQEANIYNVSSKLSVGLSNKWSSLRRSSLNKGDYFEYTVVPSIRGLSASSGNLGGQNLKIFGNLFSLKAANNTVSVDGTNCLVTAVTSEQISCTVAPRVANTTTLYSTTSGSQQNGYPSGAGLNYNRYSLPSRPSVASFAAASQSSNTTFLGTPLETAVRSDIAEGNFYGQTLYGQSWKGYFTAPVSGVYTFRGIADDTFSVYLATVPGSTELPSTPLITSTSYQVDSNFFINDNPTAEANTTLVAGKSYYLEAYHVNTAGGGTFRLVVDVPNNDSSLPFQHYQVDTIVTSSTVTPQILTISFVGGSNGSVQFRVYRPTSDPVYDESVNITYGCLASEMTTALKTFNSFSNYQISTVRNVYDAGNNLVNTTSTTIVNASRIDYLVSIYILRPTAYQTEKIIVTKNGYTGTVTQTATQTHSPLMTGQYTLKIGGVTIDPYKNGTIPFNAPNSVIQTYIQTNIVGFEQVRVDNVFTNAYGYGYGYGNKWIIRYVGVNQVVTGITVNGNGLVGPSATSVVASTRSPYYNSITFDPIDYRFLTTASNSPSVRVTVNGIPSACVGNCAYSFVDYSKITALSYPGNGTTLTLGLSDSQSKAFTLSAVTVTVGGKPCTPLTGTISSFTCTLATNDDGSPILTAGTLTPVVSIAELGIAQLDTGVSPLTIPLQAAGLTNSGANITNCTNGTNGTNCTNGTRRLLTASTASGNNGGYIIGISGNNFPTDPTQVSVSVCGNAATIQSLTNTLINIYMPSCPYTGTFPVSLTVGTFTVSSLSFTYTDASLSAPKISSLSPPSANPGARGILQIYGTGFGTDIASIKVFLANATGKIYTLNVLSVTDTYVKVGRPGGLAGVYTVQVNVANTGDSIAATAGSNTFQYSVTVTGISPSTGSINGGTLLTITGTNFVIDVAQTNVYIGVILNWFCLIDITTMTSTSIQCRTPAMSPFYAAGQSQTVTISTRLIVLNTCPGNNCAFSYLTAANSPSLTSVSLGSVGGGVNITLTGTLFNSGTCQVSLYNTITAVITVVATNACTATSATVTIPTNVPSGNYLIKIRNNLGQTNGLPLVITWQVGSSLITGSAAGGVFTFSGGSNYPADLTDSSYSVIVSTSSASNVVTYYPLNVVSCCAGNVFKLVLPATPLGTAISIVFTGPAGSNTKTFTSSGSLTSTATLTSTTPVAVGLNTVTINRTNSITPASNYAITDITLVSSFNSSHTIAVPANTWTTTTTFTSFSVTLPSGSYNIRVGSPSGYYNINSVLNVNLPASVTNTTQTTSFAGGAYTLTATTLSPVSYILVNGFKGYPITATASSVTYAVPPLVTSAAQTSFGLSSVGLIDVGQLTYFSDQTTSNVSAVFDGLPTTIYGSSNSPCWIGIEAPSGLKISVSRFRFFPNLAWKNTAQKILGATFQGSDDKTTWTTLATVDQTVRSGYNTILSTSTTPYKYFRFAHTSVSQCNIAEIALYGIVYSTTTNAGSANDVVYVDGANTVTFAGAITYSEASTPTVTLINPNYGDIFGGYDITITGTNLGAGTATVVIDGIPCVYKNSTSTTIVCTVGARPNLPPANSFTVSANNMVAVIKATFLYVLRWSDSRTWGLSLPPVAGDLIYVPIGMTLLVDQDTPQLQGIVVTNGTLLFEDVKAITVNTGFILVKGGKFIAGTESRPHANKLTFVHYGNIYGAQMPMFGNKGIMCLECSFSLYGTPRIPTWTTLAATADVGATTITLNQDVDWVANDYIAIASTSFVHEESQRRKIVSITGRTITLDAPLLYKHVSVIEQYGTSDMLTMQAEVGLLTRNIKVMGDPTSVAGEYGSHLMIAGQSSNGAEGHIAYTEFTRCGQPGVMGRYCIHFHMNGEVPTSYVRGNAVYDSFARIVTLHGVYFLTVELNVGHLVRGHNFFVEDGIETKNVIRYNLAISSLQTTKMLQTDTSVASFWITNPTNDFYGNHAAGSDFYGVWYEIKPNPDGPSATNDVCPMGNPLGRVQNNTAHSNKFFGLRIFILYARTYPCQPVRNDKLADNPWAENPSIPSVFQNFTIYKNLQVGVLAEQTGNVLFNNFVLAENYISGAEFWLANFTATPPGVTNSIIVGQSQNNQHANPVNYTCGNMTAIHAGRSGQFNFKNINIYNYPAGSIIMKTGRLNDDPDRFVNQGCEIFVENIKFTNIQSKFLYQVGIFKRDIIYDKNASFSVSFDARTNRTSATIVSGFPHIGQNAACVNASTPNNWDGAYMCDDTVTIRKVGFSNLLKKQNFNSQYMHISQRADVNDFVPNNTLSSQYTSIQTKLAGMEPKEYGAAYGAPFITGQTYQIWWGSGIDFSHLSIFTSPLYTAADPNTIFFMPYTASREFFNVGPMRGGVLLKVADYINGSSSPLDVNSCSNGDYYFNNNITLGPRYLAVCQSGSGTGRKKFEFTEVNAIACIFTCPVSGYQAWDNKTRRWSEAADWLDLKHNITAVVPTAGQNVTIPASWHMILDVSPEAIAYLIIDGLLYIDNNTANITLTAASILIRYGNLTVGSDSTRFLGSFNIVLTGSKNDAGYAVDEFFAGNKFLVVGGSLNLYGVAPTTVTTYLTATAFAGNGTLQVASITDWKVGDTIVLGPSFSDYSQFESVVITNIDNVTSAISFTPNLRYTHYGDSAITLNVAAGKLDARTRVGHVNRNIKITSGGPDTTYGYTVMIYGFRDGVGNTSNLLLGAANIEGVQFVNGGQLDSTNAPLVFQNVNTNVSTVKDSSFTNCQATCIYVLNAQNITITNNVLYNPWVFGLQVSQVQSFTFDNNLIIGVTARPTLPAGGELVACISAIEYANPQTDFISIKNNYCQGSQAHGYAFSHNLCGEQSVNPYGFNTVGSATVGFILQVTPTGTCISFSNAIAYACTIGQINGPPGKKSLVFKNFVMADNGRGLTLKLGASEGSSNHTGFLYDSYITAVSRPTCTYCYGSTATKCSNTIGMRMLAVTGNGEHLPGKFGTGFDVICRAEVFDARAYLFNVIFDNFKASYTGVLSGVCSKNFAMKQHPTAHDSVADHNLVNTQCTNCDTSSYITCSDQNPGFLGWTGGCGDIMCTGPSNYLLRDLTGSFFGFKGVIIPSSQTAVGKNEPNCVYNANMNGYVCTREDFATLEYQNADVDFRTRIMWPVNLTYDGGNYTSITNGFREWAWMGVLPENQRQGRFITVLKLNSTYNMTFNSKAPLVLQLKLRERTVAGTPTNWIIVKLWYPLPNMIQVAANGVIINPILQTDAPNSNLPSTLDKTKCGSNSYFYTNYTIHFVITEDPNCMIVVSLTETLQLTTHFSMNISQFFSNTNYLTTFINNLGALLKITDTSRIKIVGVFSGSTVITASVTPPNNSTNASDTSLTAAAAAVAVGSSAGTSATTLGAGIGTVTVVTSVYIPAPSTSSDSSSSSSSTMNIGLIIGVSIAGFILLVGIFITMVYCIRKRAKVVEEIRSSEEEFHQEQKEKPIEENSSEIHVPHYSNFKINNDKELKVEQYSGIDE